VKNVAGNTPLMTAIAAGNVEVLLHMLKTIIKTERVSIRDILSLDAKNNKKIFTWAIETNHSILIDVSVSRYTITTVFTTYVMPGCDTN